MPNHETSRTDDRGVAVRHRLIATVAAGVLLLGACGTRTDGSDDAATDLGGGEQTQDDANQAKPEVGHGVIGLMDHDECQG